MVQDIIHIFRKEFASYFRTRMAYPLMLIYAVLSMVAAFFSGYYFQLPNHNLFAFFYFQPEVFALLIPALTMKLWADERRFGTLELLLSQPVSYSALVIGKFAAAWIFCLLLLVLTIPLWLTTAAWVPLDNLNIVSSYGACFLAAGALCAVGCTVSSFSSNPVTAYIMALALILLLKIADYDVVFRFLGISGELFIRISQALNFDANYAGIISGQLTAGNLTYFVSLTVLSLWLNVVSLSYKRS